MNKSEIFEIFKSNKEIFKQYGIVKIGLFGSYARNEEKPDSDIDILVEFEKGKKTYKNFIKLCFYLDKLFKRKVDLLTTESLSPFIKPYIDKEIVYEKLY